jgi:hypothetical protein
MPRYNAKLLVTDVYRTGLNVWILAYSPDRCRHFPTGQIVEAKVNPATPIRHEYPVENDETPMITVQHDNNEGNIQRDYRIDEVLIVENIKANEVIDAITTGINSIVQLGRIETESIFARLQISPPDGEQPMDYRNGILERACWKMVKIKFT